LIPIKGILEENTQAAISEVQLQQLGPDGPADGQLGPHVNRKNLIAVQSDI
jgi:hypothetical protein